MRKLRKPLTSPSKLRPAPETALRNVFSPDVDPTSADFDTEDGAELPGNAGTMVDLDQPLSA